MQRTEVEKVKKEKKEKEWEKNVNDVRCFSLIISYDAFTTFRAFLLNVSKTEFVTLLVKQSNLMMMMSFDTGLILYARGVCRK